MLHVGFPPPIRWNLGLFKFCGAFLPAIFIYFSAVSSAAAASALLEWELSPHEDVVAYDIYFGEQSGVYYGVIYASNTNRVRINYLVPGRDYYFSAKAITSTGLESPFSNEVWFRPNLANPGSTLTLSRTEKGSVLLTGSGVPGTELAIETSEDLELWSPSGTVTVNEEGVFTFVDHTGQADRRFYRTQHL